MLKIEAIKQNTGTSYDRYSLCVNGQNDESSWCNIYDDNDLVGGIYKDEVIERLIEYSFSDIPSNIQAIQIPTNNPNTWANDVSAELIFKDHHSAKSPAIKFELRIYSEEWSKPISINEYAALLEEACININPDNIEYFQDDEFVTNGFGFIFKNINCSRSIDNVVCECLSVIDSFGKYAEKEFIEKVNTGKLSIFFDFPKEVRPACEQYLMYFIQFLRDIDIKAESEISHSRGRTLFTVIPDEGERVLLSIQASLSAYLNLTEAENISQVSNDIALKQLEANVFHLKSQLALSSATIQAKDSTINALQLSNFMLSESIETKPQKIEKSEDAFGGVVKVKSLDFKGVSIDLAEILRKVKRRLDL